MYSSIWTFIRFFTRTEFLCKCGCGFNNVDDDFVIKLNDARALSEVPFILNSACRCPIHNKNIRGSPTSSHLLGLAVDIEVLNNIDRFKILNSLLKVGFTRIGIYKNFIHVDYDLNKPQNVIWYK